MHCDQGVGCIVTEIFTQRLDAFMNDGEVLTASQQYQAVNVLGTSFGRVLVFSTRSNEVVTERQLQARDPVVGVGYDGGTIYAGQARGQITRVGTDGRTQVEEEVRNGERLCGVCVDRLSGRGRRLFSYWVQGNGSASVRVVDKSGYGLFGATTTLACRGSNVIGNVGWFGNVVCAVGGTTDDECVRDAHIYIYDYAGRGKEFQDVFTFNGIGITRGSTCCIEAIGEGRIGIVWGVLRVNIEVAPGLAHDGRKRFSQSTLSCGGRDDSIIGIGVMENRVVGCVAVGDERVLRVLVSPSASEEQSGCAVDVGHGRVWVSSYVGDVERVLVVGERSIVSARMLRDEDVVQALVAGKRYGDLLVRASARGTVDKGDIQYFWRGFIVECPRDASARGAELVETQLRGGVIDASDVVAIIGECESEKERVRVVEFIAGYCVWAYHKMRSGYDVLRRAVRGCSGHGSIVVSQDVHDALIDKGDAERYCAGTSVSVDEYKGVVERSVERYNGLLLFPELPARVQAEIGRAALAGAGLAGDAHVGEFQSFVVELDIANGLVDSACEYALRSQNPDTLMNVLSAVESCGIEKAREIAGTLGNDFDSIKMCLPQHDTVRSRVVEFRIFQSLFRIFDRTMATGVRMGVIDAVSHQVGDTHHGPLMLIAASTGRSGDVAVEAVAFICDITSLYGTEHGDAACAVDDTVCRPVIEAVVDTVDKRNTYDVTRRVLVDLLGAGAGPASVVPVLLRRSQFRAQLFDEVPDNLRLAEVSSSVRDIINSMKFTNRTLSDVLVLAKEEARKKLSLASDKRGITFSYSTTFVP